jgi:2-C-methyl-D-erythritol 4-phosphate cytidylyltransferase
MIEWSIDAFRACESVRAIVVAAPPGHEDAVGRAVGGVSGDVGTGTGEHVEDAGAVIAVVAGGATRARSVASALEVVGTGYVVIHDAARPLLAPELVEALVGDLEANPEAAGVIAAAPVADTIKRAVSSKLQLVPLEGVNRKLVVDCTEDRAQLWAAQTPQVFRTEALREAVAAAERPEEATDEAMLVERAGGTVLIHPVAEQNLKVTTPLDLRVAELLLSERVAGA